MEKVKIQTKSEVVIKTLLSTRETQERQINDLEESLKILKEEKEKTDKLLFDCVDKLPNKTIEVNGFLCEIKTEKIFIPSKTTFKYKSILEAVEEEYLLSTLWLRKIYKKFSSKTKEVNKTEHILLITQK